MAQLAGSALAVASFVGLCSTHASAGSPTVSLSSGPFADGQTITVSGKGFPSRADDATGLQVIECADPGGTSVNLPVDATTCDGATENPLPIQVDDRGSFSSPYVLSALNGAHGQANIDCDATDYCVLWVGVDYNNAFSSGPHAFSPPFEVTGSPAATTSSSSPASASAVPSGGQTGADIPAVAASTTAPAAMPVASTAGGGSLASTGAPASLPFLAGSGLVLALVGSAGRRKVARLRN